MPEAQVATVARSQLLPQRLPLKVLSVLQPACSIGDASLRNSPGEVATGATARDEV